MLILITLPSVYDGTWLNCNLLAATCCNQEYCVFCMMDYHLMVIPLCFCKNVWDSWPTTSQTADVTLETDERCLTGILCRKGDATNQRESQTILAYQGIHLHRSVHIFSHVFNATPLVFHSTPLACSGLLPKEMRAPPPQWVESEQRTRPRVHSTQQPKKGDAQSLAKCHHDQHETNIYQLNIIWTTFKIIQVLILF